MTKNTQPEHDAIYGINPAFETLIAGRRTVHAALLQDGFEKNKRLAKLAALLRERNVPIDTAHKGKLQQAANSRDHQGVVLRASPYPYVDPDDLLTGDDPVILLDNMEDPHNIGAILRSAEVLGYRKVLLPDKGTPEIYPSVVKVSAGAGEHLLIARRGSANKYVQTARERGYMIIALDGRGEEPLEDAREKLRSPWLLVIGGEDRSVGQYILNEADMTVRIEQRGKIGSLNASVAAGIAMDRLR